MFANSLSLIDECGLTFLHVFPFSARPGTPAARMRQLNGAVIARRAAALARRRASRRCRRHLAGAQGRRIQVLMESDGQGRAADFTPVRIEAGAGAGTLIDAVVSGHDGSALLARWRAMSESEEEAGLVRAAPPGARAKLHRAHRQSRLGADQAEARRGDAGRARGRADQGRSRRRHGRAHPRGARRHAP